MNRVSAFDALVYGFKGWLDNFRLFFLTMLLIMGVVLLAFTVFGLMNIPLFNEIVLFVTQKVTELKSLPTPETNMATTFLMPIGALIWKHKLMFILSVIVLNLFLAGIAAGCNRLILEVYDTGTSTPTRIFTLFSLAPRFFVFMVLMFLILAFGLIAFVLPAIYFMVRLMFAGYIIVDQDAGAVEAIQKSWALTKGYGWVIFAVLFVQILAQSGVGAYAALMGMAFATSLANVYIYRHLLARTEV